MGMEWMRDWHWMGMGNCHLSDKRQRTNFDRKQGHILKNNLYSDTNYIFQCNILSQTDRYQKQKMTLTLYLVKVLLLTDWWLGKKHGLNAQFTAWISGIFWAGPGLHRDQKTWVFLAPLVPILTHIFRVSINIFNTSFSHFPGSKHKNFWSLQKISWISFAKNNQKQNTQTTAFLNFWSCILQYYFFWSQKFRDAVKDGLNWIIKFCPSLTTAHSRQ